MQTMTAYEFGDIVLVPFPFTDQTAAKKRPADVVSSGAYDRNRPDVILMAVTSQGHALHFGDIAVKDRQQAGLLKPSVIKPIFTTIEKGLVLSKLGRLSQEDRAALKEALQSILRE
jgi:mRNA interferase MazF